MVEAYFIGCGVDIRVEWVPVFRAEWGLLVPILRERVCARSVNVPNVGRIDR